MKGIHTVFRDIKNGTYKEFGPKMRARVSRDVTMEQSADDVALTTRMYDLAGQAIIVRPILGIDDTNWFIQIQPDSEYRFIWHKLWFEKIFVPVDIISIFRNRFLELE